MASAPASDVTLRAAAVADIDEMLPLVRELFRGESIPWDEARTWAALARLLGDAELGAVTLAVHGDAVVGYAIVTWGFDLEFAGRDAFLTELYVDATARRAGLGARLLAHAIEVARAAGAGALHLQVRRDNDGARRLYDRTGFSASPRVLMSRPL